MCITIHSTLLCYPFLAQIKEDDFSKFFYNIKLFTSLVSSYDICHAPRLFCM